VIGALLADPWRRSIALAMGLVAAGFAAIILAWVGVAATLSVPEQVAFSVSGGFGGFALTGMGLALLDVQRRRMEAALERRDLHAFAADLTEIAELIAARHLARPTVGARTSRGRRRVLRAR
jgi:threonine/homoserine/homoserine lactone efflux protein